MKRLLIVLMTAAALGGFFIAPAQAWKRCGRASWYGPESGSITANGARFRPDGLSAAMPNRAMLGRHVRVTDMRTERSVVVIINDLGPARWTGRAIDLSRGAARALGMLRRGVATVCVSQP